MPQTPKRFVFRPLWTTVGAVATVVTILLGVLQIGSWVNEHAPWILWVAVATLIIVALLLVARIAAVRIEKEGVAEELVVARADVVIAQTENVAAHARIRELETALRHAAPLSEVDRGLARQLYEYASDAEALDMLSLFFPYQIPHEPVSKMEELANLPRTRSAHDVTLSHHLTDLSEAATQWLTKLQQIVSTDGDYYTTRLDQHVSQKVYQQHTAMTNELGSAGFELHTKLLEYQRYYASLET
ncbi:hypothetical protein [Microbacterium binotii]|uniref:hypothetical protein n=1 Tax=Microbacterium binotii TaxID=462710 RepID=UPI001F28AE3E|nr:hypothetical protein [Microbacterium binotii]UIN30520.1 hypothetical protein LXM64_15460 [Microbacterium binotii]